MHLKPFLRNFFVLYEKDVRYTPVSNISSFQDLVMDFQRLFYANHEFENRTFVWVRLIVFFLFGEFDFIRLSNSIRELSSIRFDWNLVPLGSIYYAGSYKLDINTVSVQSPFLK